MSKDSYAPKKPSPANHKAIRTLATPRLLCHSKGSDKKSNYGIGRPSPQTRMFAYPPPYKPMTHLSHQTKGALPHWQKAQNKKHTPKRNAKCSMAVSNKADSVDHAEEKRIASVHITLTSKKKPLLRPTKNLSQTTSLTCPHHICTLSSRSPQRGQTYAPSSNNTSPLKTYA